MRWIRNWLSREENHTGSSMVAFNYVGHGTEHGILTSADGQGCGLQISDIVGTLTDVKCLVGKPKLLFLNACRGGKYKHFKAQHELNRILVLCKRVSGGFPYTKYMYTTGLDRMVWL